MQAEDIEAPDITGFETAMRDFIDSCDKSGQPGTPGAAQIVARFIADYRRMDAWIMQSKRCTAFAPNEPVLYKGEVGVVLAVTSSRVHCRLFMVPRHGTLSVPRSILRHLNPAHLRKVSSRKTWTEWREGIMHAGLAGLDEWTSREVTVEDIEDMAAGAFG